MQENNESQLPLYKTQILSGLSSKGAFSTAENRKNLNQLTLKKALFLII